MKITTLQMLLLTSALIGACRSQQEDIGLPNNVNFYDKGKLLSNLPDFPIDPQGYSQETYESYRNASAKGNDQGSTKKADLIRWHEGIRHADKSDVYRNFNGSSNVYVESPSWQAGALRIGVLSKPYLENSLDFYNLMRGLFGGQRVFLSGYKQVAAQASSFSDLNGGHGPKAEDAAARGITGAFFEAVYHGRASGNLQGGKVNTDFDYKGVTRMDRNDDLTSIWNEATSDKLAGMGHRATFMFSGGKDVGIGIVAGYHTWVTYGAAPEKNNGMLLGGQEQKAILDRYPAGKLPIGVVCWPSHGYFPFFALRDGHQGWGMTINKEYASAPSKDERVKVLMEYFVHEQDGDLSQLTQPVASLQLWDIAGSGAEAGGKGPDNNGPDYALPGSQYQQGGGYHFSMDGASFPIRFRMPRGWFDQMKNDMSTSTPKYHTVRYTFISEGGQGFKVLKPFYMNQQVGQSLVVQTTFFDIQKHK